MRGSQRADRIGEPALALVRSRKIEVRERISGVGLDRGVIARDGLVEPPGVEVEAAQIHKRRRVGGPGFERAFEVGTSLIRTAGAGERNAALVQKKHASLGSDVVREQRVEGCNRLRGAAAAEQREGFGGGVSVA